MLYLCYACGQVYDLADMHDEDLCEACYRAKSRPWWIDVLWASAGSRAAKDHIREPKARKA